MIVINIININMIFISQALVEAKADVNAKDRKQTKGP